MQSLFIVLTFIAIVLFWIGIIKPSLVIRFGNKRGRLQVLLYYGIAILVLLYLTGVTGPKESHTVKANNTTKMSKVTKPVKKNIEVHISNSVGLGDSKSWVEKHLGKPSLVQDKKMGNYAYQHNGVQVTYTRNIVSFYELDFDSKHEITLPQGKALAKAMIPNDAVYLKTYNHDQGGATQKIDVYKSKKLSALWPASDQMFTNADGVNQPGVFDVAYTYDTLIHPKTLMSVVVFASDNP